MIDFSLLPTTKKEYIKWRLAGNDFELFSEDFDNNENWAGIDKWFYDNWGWIKDLDVISLKLSGQNIIINYNNHRLFGVGRGSKSTAYPDKFPTAYNLYYSLLDPKEITRE